MFEKAYISDSAANATKMVVALFNAEEVCGDIEYIESRIENAMNQYVNEHKEEPKDITLTEKLFEKLGKPKELFGVPVSLRIKRGKDGKEEE